MPRAAAKTTATKTTAEVFKGRRISLGSLWETRNEDFFSGVLKPSDGRYSNQQEILDHLPEPTVGTHWVYKAWVKQVPVVQAGETVMKTVIETVYQEELNR
jgi:hypothetical protein